VSDPSTLRERDVVRYQPDSTWCREGLAIALPGINGTLALFDTYWYSDRKLVTPSEFEVLFNLDDYRPISEWSWKRYAPADREIVTHQHGLQVDFYVRKGANESRAQLIENARNALAVADGELLHAVSNRERAQHALDELLTVDGEESNR
jgi:hypothetical protein